MRRIPTVNTAHRRSLVCVLLLPLLLTASQVLAQARPNVLLLFDEDNDLPGLATINRSLRQGFEAGLHDGVGFYTESLQLSQFKAADYDLLVADYFRRKYDHKQVSARRRSGSGRPPPA